MYGKIYRSFYALTSLKGGPGAGIFPLRTTVATPTLQNHIQIQKTTSERWRKRTITRISTLFLCLFGPLREDAEINEELAFHWPSSISEDELRSSSSSPSNLLTKPSPTLAILASSNSLMSEQPLHLSHTGPLFSIQLAFQIRCYLWFTLVFTLSLSRCFGYFWSCLVLFYCSVFLFLWNRNKKTCLVRMF